MAPIIEMKSVSKYFSKVIANKDVSLHVNEGEVLALLGENGAGKSTIMKILYGLYRLDEGEIFIRGEKQNIQTPKDAMQHGVAMIQQHFSLVPSHSVTENIVLGNVKGHLNIDEYNGRIKKITEEYGFDLPVESLVGELSVGMQQKVEILKALYLNTKVLIMDEPTAVLTPQESDNLMEFIKGYTKNGNSVVFITHKMKEVMAVADRIVVMRDGKVAGTVNKADTDEVQLARMMIGQDLPLVERKEHDELKAAPIILSLDHASIKEKGLPAELDDVSIHVRAGEILGIAGVSGNGQDSICEVICGIKSVTEGVVKFNGEDISKYSIRSRIDAGIGYVPVDRYRDGMIMDMTLLENMMLKSSYDKRWTKHGFLDYKAIRAYTESAIKGHRVKAPGADATARSLSGGNQQKLVLAREIDVGTHAIIFNQPTRGLDMGAVERIHAAILEEREKGKAILLVSTELSELFTLCDRIAVMHKGRIMGVFENGTLPIHEISLMMAGVSNDPKEASNE